MAVTIDEANDSPSFSISSLGKLIATRKWYFAWTDLNDMIAELKPPTIITGDQIQQSPGAAYPGNDLLRVDTVNIVPFPNTTSTGVDGFGVNAYEKAMATVTYRIPPFAIDEDDAAEQGDPVPFLTHSGTGGGEFLKLPGAGLEWEADNEALAEEATAGVFVGFTKHSITWPRVVSPFWDRLESYKGHVNSAAFKLRNYEYPAETLLYENYSFSQEVMTDGTNTSTRAWNITMNFTSKQVPDEEGGTGGFNHMWRDFGIGGDFSGWYRIQRTDGAASTKKVYPTKDFADLFKAST